MKPAGLHFLSLRGIIPSFWIRMRIVGFYQSCIYLVKGCPVFTLSDKLIKSAKYTYIIFDFPKIEFNLLCILRLRDNPEMYILPLLPCFSFFKDVLLWGHSQSYLNIRQLIQICQYRVTWWSSSNNCPGVSCKYRYLQWLARVQTWLLRLYYTTH